MLTDKFRVLSVIVAFLFTHGIEQVAVAGGPRPFNLISKSMSTP
jgi:hypothetical protein